VVGRKKRAFLQRNNLEEQKGLFSAHLTGSEKKEKKDPVSSINCRRKTARQGKFRQPVPVE